MVPTILTVRPTQSVDTLVRSSGLNCVMKSRCGFWKVGRVHESLPTILFEILKSHAAVVQKTLIDMGRLAVGPRRPDVTRYRFDDLTELAFALPQCLFSDFELFDIQVHADP